MFCYVQGLIKRDNRWDNDKKQFLPLEVPVYEEQVGSFAVMILDSRNKLSTMISDSRDFYRRHRIIDNLSGFRIIKDTHKRFINSDTDRSKTIHEYIDPNTE